MPGTALNRAFTDARDIFEDATDEERRYFQLVDRAMEAADPSEPISNGKPAHAVYILNTFLQNAEEHVRICTGTLARTFDGVLAYGNHTLVQSAHRFLSKPDTRLSIIIVDAPDIDDGQGIEHHPLLAGLKDVDEGRLRVSSLRGDTAADFNHHFVVMDSEALRVEVEPDKAKAFVIFGDESFAEGLANLFDSMEEDSEQLFPRLHAAA